MAAGPASCHGISSSWRGPSRRCTTMPTVDSTPWYMTPIITCLPAACPSVRPSFRLNLFHARSICRILVCCLTSYNSTREDSFRPHELN